MNRDDLGPGFSKWQDTEQWKKMWGFRNFTRSEFVCQCCGQLPSIAEIHYAGIVMCFLQPLRSRLKKKVIINRGYSCPEHNKRVGGSARSFHTIPEDPTVYHPCAVDFWVPGIPAPQIEFYIMDHTDLNFCGFHVYPRFGGAWYAHIDFRGVRARW